MTFGVLGWAVIHSVWQVAAVGAALAVFLRLGRASARLRYAASFGALLLAAILAVATGVVLAGTHAGVAEHIGGTGAPGAGSPEAMHPVFAIHAAVAPAAERIGLVWLVVVVMLIARWAGAWLLVARRTSRATRPARAAWTAWLRVVAAQMGVTSPVELRESATVDTPTLVGHRRPIVVLPVPAFEALARAEAESVLAHELAHVRRGDFVANAVQTVVEILLFFHPLVRWMSRTVRDQREQCCDDVAVRTGGSRLVYVRALARLEMLRLRGPLVPLTLGAAGGSLLRRIERLAGERPTAGPVAARPVLLLAAAGTLSCLAVVGSLVLPPTAHALAAANRAATRYTVHAHDPAGEFSVTFERGRPTRATVGGVAVAPDRLVTRGDSLFLPSGNSAGYFALHLKPGGFTWTPRRRSP